MSVSGAQQKIGFFKLEIYFRQAISFLAKFAEF